MTRIIAFSGRKQSGKSTGAEYVQSLLTEHGISNKVYSFADPLKQDICINMLGLSYEQCYGSDDEKNSLTDICWENIPGYTGHNHGLMTAREVMEVIGTNIFRKIKSNVWVNATLNFIKKEKHDVAIIADCRFPNEVDNILNNDGIVIRITKDPFQSSADAEVALDSQNYDWSKFSIIIDNQLLSVSEKNQVLHQFLHDIGILDQ